VSDPVINYLNNCALKGNTFVCQNILHSVCFHQGDSYWQTFFFPHKYVFITYLVKLHCISNDTNTTHVFLLCYTICTTCLWKQTYCKVYVKYVFRDLWKWCMDDWFKRSLAVKQILLLNILVWTELLFVWLWRWIGLIHDFPNSFLH